MNGTQLTQPKTIFLDPKTILHEAGLRAGMHVADLGCGGGYFVLEAAREIGEQGVAYGVDILQSALSAVASRARMYGLYNVRTVWSNAEVPGGARQIKDHTIDVVLLVQLLSQSHKHREIFKEAARVAKEDGIVLVVDWRSDHGYRFGPSDKDCLHEAEIASVADTLGWRCVDKFAAGPYHVGMIFGK